MFSAKVGIISETTKFILPKTPIRVQKSRLTKSFQFDDVTPAGKSLRPDASASVYALHPHRKGVCVLKLYKNVQMFKMKMNKLTIISLYIIYVITYIIYII